MDQRIKKIHCSDVSAIIEVVETNKTPTKFEQRTAYYMFGSMGSFHGTGNSPDIAGTQSWKALTINIFN
jgi:hypothetical protein